VTPAGFKTVASRINYKEVKINEVTCDAETCKVKLLLTYAMPKMKEIHTPLEESWVIDKGQAWYVWLL